MIVAQQVDESAAEVSVDDVPTAGVADEGAANVNIDDALTAVDEPSIPSPTPTTQPPPPSQDVPSTSQVQPTLPPSPIDQPTLPQQQPQPSQDAKILMDLLHNLLDICTTLTRRVENLEQEKIAQALEITKLKHRVKKLERMNKLKERIIASMDADVDVSLKNVADIAKEVDADAEINESRKSNFTKYIFDSLVRNVDSSTKFYMYPQFLQLMIRAQVGDLSSHTTSVDDVPTAGVADEGAANVNIDAALTAVDEPSIPSPTPTTQPPPPSQDVPSTSQVQPTLPPSPIDQPPLPQQQPQPLQDAKILMDLLHNLLDICTTLTRRVENLEQE
nr:hypothetical protein [Tanacetum cinerariifolium]